MELLLETTLRYFFEICVSFYPLLVACIQIPANQHTYSISHPSLVIRQSLEKCAYIRRKALWLLPGEGVSGALLVCMLPARSFTGPRAVTVRECWALAYLRTSKLRPRISTASWAVHNVQAWDRHASILSESGAIVLRCKLFFQPPVHLGGERCFRFKHAGCAKKHRGITS